MKVLTRVDVAFERVAVNAHGNAGRVHLTLNREPLCGASDFKGYRPKGVEFADPDDFADEYCERCHRMLSPKE